MTVKLVFLGRRGRRRRRRLSSEHGDRHLGCRRRLRRLRRLGSPGHLGRGCIQLGVDGRETFAEDGVVGLEVNVQHGPGRHVLRRQLRTVNGTTVRLAYSTTTPKF